ncbi:MAG: MFS transporter [Candidatus Thorarchaeota archaeon]
MSKQNKLVVSPEFSDTRNAWNMIVASLIVNIGFGLAIPLFTELGNDIDIGNLGFTRLQPALAIGILLASFMIVRMITSYLIPDITDSAGRKNILIIGLILYGIATFLIGFSRDFWVLLILRGLEGGSTGIAFPISEALLVDSVAVSKRGEWMGKFFITFNAGFALGPAVGGVLYIIAEDFLGLNKVDAFILPYGLTGLMGITSALVVYLFVHDIFKPIKSKSMGKDDNDFRIKEMNVGKTYKVPFLSRLYAISVINGFGIGLISPIFTLYALNEFKMSNNGVLLIFTVAGLVALPINWISGKLSDKFNRVSLAMVGMAIGTVAFIGLGFLTSLILVIAFFVFRFMAMMFFVPAYRAFMADIIPPIVRGRYFGRIQAIFNLGASSAPIIGGWMYDNLTEKTFTIFSNYKVFGAGFIFIFCAFISLLSTIIIYFIYKAYNPEVHRFKNTIQMEQTESSISEPSII